MNYNDWDPDDLLDFDYGKKTPKSSQQTEQSHASGLGSSNDSYDELRRYQELRHKEVEQAPVKPASSRAHQWYQGDNDKKAQPEPVEEVSKIQALQHKIKPAKAVKPVKPAKTVKSAETAGTADAGRKSSSDKKTPVREEQAGRTPEEAAALKQAQQEAYDRYRSTYNKNTRNKYKKKAGKFTKGLSLVYLIALVIFLVSITIMNILPFGLLVAMYVVLGLLSLIIVIQLRKGNVKKWVRVLASLTSVLLIVFYGMGAAYSMGTLSFLDVTSVDNPNKVALITREPFNVCITGMDVKGKIDTEGRSDVNMILTINPATHQILMTSIPRDYQIYMPDKEYAMDKLTHTGFYSVDTTIGAEQDLLDTKINYFVKVNFSTVEKFIDAIGGVDVYSEYSFTPVKLKSWTVQEGMNHMTGKQALAFARERKAFVTGDNQRIKNQQAVFEAMFKKATSSRTMVLSYNKVMSELKDYFQMSFSSRELRSLIKMQIAKNPDWRIYKNTLVGGDGSLPTYTTGGAYAYVMTQDETSVQNARTLIKAVLDGKKLIKNKDGVVSVEGAETEQTEEGQN